MEQKRTLWIVAAVGVFLLVVIGAALILYSPTSKHDPVMPLSPSSTAWVVPPNQNPASSLARTSGDRTAQVSILPDSASVSAAGTAPISASGLPSGSYSTPSDYSAAQNRNPAAAQNLSDLTVISGTTHVYGNGTTTIDLNALKSPQVAEAFPEVLVQSVSNVIPENTVAKTAVAAVEKKAPSAPSATKAPPAKPVASAKTTTPQAVSANQYWVQAAAFTNKQNADAARTALTDNKMPGEIFTHTDSRGKVFYRVRVGPYTTKSEAEYWRTRIVLIDQFSESQVIVNTATSM